MLLHTVNHTDVFPSGPLVNKAESVETFSLKMSWRCVLKVETCWNTMHNTIAQWDYSQHVCLLSKSGSNLNPTQAQYLRPIFLAQELLVSWSQHSIMSTNWSRIKNSLSFPGGFHICHVQVIHIDPDKVEAAQRLRLRWTPALSNAATHRLWSWQSQQASTMETGLWSRVEIAVRNSTYCINYH